MARALMGAYNRALNAYPLLTHCSTTDVLRISQLFCEHSVYSLLTKSILLAAGDVIAQKVIEKPKEINWKRTAKFGVFGFCFLGPALSTWFKTLERLYGSAGRLTPLKKVATDQLCFAPILQFVNIPILGLMGGDSWEKIETTIRKDYKDIMIANWRLWPFVQMVNFYVIPINYRVPVVAFVSLFWNIYYTWKLGEKK